MALRKLLVGRLVPFAPDEGLPELDALNAPATPAARLKLPEGIQVPYLRASSP